MEKKNIYRFPAPVTHVTPIHDYDLSRSQIIHSQNLPKSKRLMSNIHNSLAMAQWRKKISIDFLLLLHMLHQYTTMTFLVLRLSTVKIFPRASVQTKKLMLDGTLTFQIVFHGNEELVGVDKF
jgi:hypothetical protein